MQCRWYANSCLNLTNLHFAFCNFLKSFFQKILNCGWISGCGNPCIWRTDFTEIGFCWFVLKFSLSPQLLGCKCKNSAVSFVKCSLLQGVLYLEPSYSRFRRPINALWLYPIGILICYCILILLTHERCCMIENIILWFSLRISSWRLNGFFRIKNIFRGHVI